MKLNLNTEKSPLVINEVKGTNQHADPIEIELSVGTRICCCCKNLCSTEAKFWGKRDYTWKACGVRF